MAASPGLRCPVKASRGWAIADEEATVQMADKRAPVRDAAFAPVRTGEEDNPSPCIFGRPEIPPLLGATTCRSSAWRYDPVKEKLVPTIGVLATDLGRRGKTEDL
jgi:hypothetical protein